MISSEFIKFFKESKVLCKEMGQIENYEYLIHTLSTSLGLTEDKTVDELHNYLCNKFLKSNYFNLDKFIEKELTTEDGVQISSNIPVKNRPERPIENELEEDFTILSEEEQNDKISEFLDKIKLKDLDKDKAEVFLSRYKELISSHVDDEKVVDLLIYLLYQAWKKELDPNEQDELEDIIDKIENEEDLKESYLIEKEKKDKESNKIGVTATIIGSTLLFGIGGLLVSGLMFALSGESQSEFEKSKEEVEKMKLDNEKIKLLQDREKMLQDAQKKEKSNSTKDKPEPPENFEKEIIEKGEEAKKDLPSEAKETYQAKQDKEDKPEPEVQKEPEPEVQKEPEDSKAEDEKNLKPDEFHKKYGKCPTGWNWDPEKNACVKSEKFESINYYQLLF